MTSCSDDIRFYPPELKWTNRSADRQLNRKIVINRIALTLTIYDLKILHVRLTLVQNNFTLSKFVQPFGRYGVSKFGYFFIDAYLEPLTCKTSQVIFGLNWRPLGKVWQNSLHGVLKYCANTFRATHGRQRQTHVYTQSLGKNDRLQILQ